MNKKADQKQVLTKIERLDPMFIKECVDDYSLLIDPKFKNKQSLDMNNYSGLNELIKSAKQNQIDNSKISESTTYFDKFF